MHIPESAKETENNKHIPCAEIDIGDLLIPLSNGLLNPSQIRLYSERFFFLWMNL